MTTDKQSPTEDTPTHDPQQDNLPPFHFRCQQGNVHSIEEGCDCTPKQDDSLTPQSSNTGAIPSQSNNSGAMQQLREAIFKAAEVTYQPYTLNNPHPKQVVKIPLDDLMSLFTTAQIQLVSELLEHSREYEVTDLEKLDHWNETPLVAIPASVLEHKKQELEKGK